MRFRFLILLLCIPAPLSANETRNFQGLRGLNTIPDARFDEKGAVTLTLSHADPYTHGALGYQITENLYLSLRQNAEGGNPFETAHVLYPGIDGKIKLLDETAQSPAVALGLDSAFGHKRMASEYISLSKRWNDFDFTGGLGWGRYGQAKHFKNPLHIISHFDKPRAQDGDIANAPSDWFTGEHIGVFGGVAYQLPMFDDLTLTADWNSDRYRAEQASANYNAPAPWSVGLQYQPHESVSAGIGILGTDKIMGRLTLSPSIPDWPYKTAKKKAPAPPLSVYRPEHGKIENISRDAAAEGYRSQIIGEDAASLKAALSLEPFETAPAQIGRLARHMARNAPGHIGSFTITPRFAGLQGPNITLIREDLENAIALKSGSAEEIWHAAEFDNTLRPSRFKGFNRTSLWPEKIILEQHISLSEEDHGLLSRTSLIIEEQRELIGSLATGAAVRVDLTNNLDNLNTYRGHALLPVRSDIDRFAQRRFSLDRFYLSYLKTLQPDLHLNITGGYLEEQYAGLGGEFLYRPFGKNWALGAEAWQVFKRDPFSSLNQGLTIDSLLTGHVNAYYRLPDAPKTTVNARFGRYLAEDIGGSLGVKHRFKNGASLEGFVTLTDMTDLDIFGGNTNLHHGIKLSLPIGSVDFIPQNSRIDLLTAPFGRDAGQALDKPVDLYDLTEAFSLQHMAMHWGEVVE